MALEELRKKVLYQNSIEIWIGISKEKREKQNHKKYTRKKGVRNEITKSKEE